MNKEKLKIIITKLLICFALISIGFALGKNSVRKNSVPHIENSPESGENYVTVFYMHATKRCVSCNTIEQMTKRLLDKHYAGELKNGDIKWATINFQENESLAEKFGIMASCVVVTDTQNGELVNFECLNKVWNLMKDPPAFDQYISEVIDTYLHSNMVAE